MGHAQAAAAAAALDIPPFSLGWAGKKVREKLQIAPKGPLMSTALSEEGRKPPYAWKYSLVRSTFGCSSCRRPAWRALHHLPSSSVWAIIMIMNLAAAAAAAELLTVAPPSRAARFHGFLRLRCESSSVGRPAGDERVE